MASINNINLNTKIKNDEIIASSSALKPPKGRRSKKSEAEVLPRRQSVRQAKQRNESTKVITPKKNVKSKKKIESSEEDEDDDDVDEDWSMDEDEDYLATMFKKVPKENTDDKNVEDELFQDDENDKDVYDFDQQSSIVSSRQVKDKKWLNQQAKMKSSFKVIKSEPMQNPSWGSNIYSYLATFLNTREELDIYSRYLKCSYVNKSLDQAISDLCKPFRNLNLEGPTASLQNLMAKINDNATVVGLMKEIMSDRFENAAHRISHFVSIVSQPINGLVFYPKFNEILHQIDGKIISESGFIIEVEKSESRKNIPDVDTIVITDSFYSYVCEKLLGQSSRDLQRLVLGIDENKSLIGLFVLDSWNRAGVPYNRSRIKYNTSNAAQQINNSCEQSLPIISNGESNEIKTSQNIDFIDGFFVRMGGKKDVLHLVTKIESKFLVFNVVSEYMFAFKKHGLSSKTPIVLEGMYSTFSEVLGEEKSILIIPDQFYKSLLKTLHKEIHLPNCKFKKFVLLDKQTRAPLGVFFDTDVTLDIQIHDRILSEQQLSILPQTYVQNLKPTKQNVMLGSLNGILVGFEITPQKYITKCYEIISDSCAKINPQIDKRNSIQTLYLAPNGMSTTVQFCNTETGENTYVSASLFENIPYCKRQEQIDDFLNEIADKIFDLPLQISLFDSIWRLYHQKINGSNGDCRDDSCVFCGREFKASANVYDHEIRHVGLIRFKCHKHQMVFTDMKSYKSHHEEFIDCESESETELEQTQKLLNISASLSDCPQCDKCYDYFPQADILRLHLDICDGVSFNARTPLDSKYDPGEALTSECFICGICGLNYSKLDILCSHMNNHLSCNVCKTRLGSIDEVSQHLRDHLHKNENVSGPGKRKILICDICNDFYGTKVNYYYHQWNEHGVVHPPIKTDESAEPLYKRRTKRMNELSYMATGMKKFSCKFCNAEVKVAGRDYVKHLDVKHGLTVELDTLCRICADIFETPERLSDHLRENHIQSGEYINAGIQSIFSCDKCTFFGHFRGVVAHSTSVHADSNPCLYECPHCPERMADRRLWRIHLEKHEENQLTFTCDECQTYFKNEAALKLHLETFHGVKQNDLKCSICEKDFSNSQEIRVHILEEHEGCVELYPFSCFMCQEKFLFENELQAHQEVHGGMMQCDLCQKVCKSMKAYELHRMKHFRTRIFQCTECQATFRSKLAMRRHIRVDHLNLEPERYECQICGKIVTQISMHMLIHKNARYQCEYCGKRFTKSAYYNEHVRIHKGEKPYECHICQRRFNKKSNLNVHINFHEKHRDDYGNYLEIKPRGRGHPDYDPQKTIARKNAQKKIDAICGPDIQIIMENVLINSKSCDTSDLDANYPLAFNDTDAKKRKIC